MSIIYKVIGHKLLTQVCAAATHTVLLPAVLDGTGDDPDDGAGDDPDDGTGDDPDDDPDDGTGDDTCDGTGSVGKTMPEVNV